VESYNVLFGSENFNLIGSTRFDLPWQITAIQVVFSEPIKSGNVNSLTGVSTTGFSGLGTATLKWNISTPTEGNFATMLVGTGTNALKDAAGNPLVGGNGFAQSFNVLYGDFNDDGVVSSSDMVGVHNATAGPYNIFADMNGDGVVNLADVQIVRTQIGAQLTGGGPAAELIAIGSPPFRRASAGIVNFLPSRRISRGGEGSPDVLRVTAVPAGPKNIVAFGITDGVGNPTNAQNIRRRPGAKLLNL
jgi:hypothetical protein